MSRNIPVATRMLSQPVKDLFVELEDRGYIVFDASRPITGSNFEDYFLVMEEDGYWVLRYVLDYGLGSFTLKDHREELEEVRNGLFHSSSTYSDGRNHDCGYAIYNSQDGNMYFAPYTKTRVEDVEKLDLLMEVIS